MFLDNSTGSDEISILTYIHARKKKERHMLYPSYFLNSLYTLYLI